MRVISLSLAHLGLGLILIQSLVGLREVGRGFFTLCGGCGVVLTALGWLLSHPTGTPPPEGPLPWAVGAAACALFAIAWGFLKARRRDVAAPFHHTAGAAAGFAVILQGWLLARAAGAGAAAGAAVARGAAAPSPIAGAGFAAGALPSGGDHGVAIAVALGADFLLSAALLGGVTVAMVLGHWYLVQPGLSIVPLRRLAWAFVVVLGLRVVQEAVATAGAVTAGALTLAPPAGEVLPFPLLVLLQRDLFGLAAPLLLAPLVYRTVTMRSTMSATGLLYVAVALVWVGEFLSKYLLLPLRMA